MRVIFMFCTALFVGISYVQAGDDHYIPIEYDDDDDDWDDDRLKFLKNYSRDLYRNKTLERDQKESIEKIKKMIENQDQMPETKPFVRVMGGVTVVLVIGGLSLCCRLMCKKKPTIINADPEETVPALPPDLNQLQPIPHLPPQVPYEEPNSYLQQPPSYPPQLIPHPQQPNPYPQQLSPYPQQLSPYPEQPNPYTRRYTLC